MTTLIVPIREDLRMTSTNRKRYISVRLEDDAMEAIALLLETGQQENVSKAANFLLAEGVKAQKAYLESLRPVAEEVLKAKMAANKTLQKKEPA